MDPHLTDVSEGEGPAPLLPSPELTLLHVHGPEIGYGQLGVGLAKGLQELGVDVFDHQDAPPGAVQSFGDRQVAEGQRSKTTKHIGWVSVPTHARGWLRAQRPFIFTMYEATVLPPSFRENLHEFETVIVPSEQNKTLFDPYHSNVQVVPLGIDCEEWRFQERREPVTFFDFLIGGSGPRKGGDLALRAFLELWGEDGSWPADGPIPRLIMKSPKGEDVVHPRVEVISGKISAEEQVALYAAAHCYVQPSRGEGFGLQPLQAIAQGLPTILTDAHGHEAFARLGIPLRSDLVPAGPFIYGDSGLWWEPDFDQLKRAMVDVYSDYASHCEWAKVSSEIAHADFSWRRCAEQFVEALGGVDALREPFDGDESDWFAPEAKRYPVVVLKPWHAEIAGQHFDFEPGETYYESADVKRILFETEVLDPCCIQGEDHGLLPAQVEAIGAYSAAHSHCRSCGQPLNTQVTREAEILAELEAAAAERESGVAA